MYVDRQMVQIGAFYIQNTTETAQNQSAATRVSTCNAMT